MAAAAGPLGDGLVVELGPGTGPVTRALLDRGLDRARLVLVEYDPSFCRMLEERFEGVRVIRGDAYDLPRTLAPLEGERVVAFVSSLPLLNEAPRRRETLVADAFGRMALDGVFVQFTYGLVSPVPRAFCAGGYSAHATAPIWRNPAAGAGLDLSQGALPMKPRSPRDRLIVALDLPDPAEAERLVERIGDAANFYKIGMELAYGGGLPLVTRLAKAGKQIFLDLKLHDIPNTVERATAQAARLGATFLTVHAYPQTMAAALKGAAGSPLGILAVTVLTSCDDEDLVEAGYRLGVVAMVEKRAEQAKTLGVAGLVASAAEARDVRRTVGETMILVTPGIRPSGAEVGDQKRVATPAEAIAAGADYLVVGRPVTGAADPRAAAAGIVAEIAAAS